MYPEPFKGVNVWAMTVNQVYLTSCCKNKFLAGLQESKLFFWFFDFREEDFGEKWAQPGGFFLLFVCFLVGFFSVCCFWECNVFYFIPVCMGNSNDITAFLLHTWGFFPCVFLFCHSLSARAEKWGKIFLLSFKHWLQSFFLICFHSLFLLVS